MTKKGKDRYKSHCQRCFDSNFIIECGDNCGEIIFKRDKYHRSMRYKKGHGQRGELHPKWKGGRITDNDGYIKILKPNRHNSDINGYVFEHVYVFEEYYNVCLLPHIVVHHINENKHDNRIENLQSMTISEHMKLHNPRIDMSNRVCKICNESETYEDTKDRARWYGDAIEGWICTKCYNKEVYRLWRNDNPKPTIEKICSNCGTDKTYVNKNGSERWFKTEQNEYLCHSCYLKLGPVKDIYNRKCLICKSDKTYIKKNGSPAWHRYEDGWRCNSCRTKNISKVKAYNRKSNNYESLRKYVKDKKELKSKNKE